MSYLKSWYSIGVIKIADKIMVMIDDDWFLWRIL